MELARTRHDSAVSRLVTMVTSCLLFVVRNHFDTAALTKITQEISDNLFWSLGTAVLWDRGNNNSYSSLKFENRERIGSSNSVSKKNMKILV